MFGRGVLFDEPLQAARFSIIAAGTIMRRTAGTIGMVRACAHQVECALVGRRRGAAPFDDLKISLPRGAAVRVFDPESHAR
jgi:hypothetical protein